MDEVKEADIIYKELTYQIIGSAMEVHKVLGNGFLEKVYENALFYEMKSKGMDIKAQQPIEITYKGQVVGNYVTDLIVNDRVIIELKAVERLTEVHEAQTINYLMATKYPIALLINFGAKSLEYKRFIHTKK